MNWKYFVGASILTCGLLFKFGAPLPALVLGVGLAALACWGKTRKPG